MRWGLVAVLFVAILTIFAWASSGGASAAALDAEPFAAAEGFEAAAAAASPSDAAFDAYVRVHGKPPGPEALQYYRKMAAAAAPPMTEAQLVEAIKRDAAPAATVDAELQKLKARAETADALSAPIAPAATKPAGQNDMLMARLQGITAQLSDITSAYTAESFANAASAPKGLESFIAFR